ncbi:UNVERIFIED_CONTAM: hypothetical protein ABIC26_004293 [Paenibacillus sp. PvR008]
MLSIFQTGHANTLKYTILNLYKGLYVSESAHTLCKRKRPHFIGRYLFNV